MTYGRATGKVILLGEHFVVYGAPALAVPLRSRCVNVHLDYEAGSWQVPDASHSLLERMLLMVGLVPENVSLEVDGDLPLGQGLGGSAALAVALLRALGHTESRELQDRAHVLEQLSHGHPSGIDDTVVTWERPVYFIRGEGPTVLERCPSSRIWVATTGQRGSTKESVAQVRQWKTEHEDEFATMLDAAARLVQEGREDLERGRLEALGEKMTQNHALLQGLSVSTPDLDRLVDAAMAAGALGAKLTGAGLGGAIVALAPPDLDLEPALATAGADEVIAP